MKKRIPLLLALTLLLSLGSAALADEGNSHPYTPGDNYNMSQKVTTTIPSNKVMWHLVIPDTVTITSGGYEGKQDLGDVSIVLDGEGQLTDDQKIEAYLTYDGFLSYDEDVNVKLPYLLSDKAAQIDESSGDYQTLETGKAYVVTTKTKSNTTYNSPEAWVGSGEWDSAASGDYTGTVVYSSKLIETNA